MALYVANGTLLKISLVDFTAEQLIGELSDQPGVVKIGRCYTLPGYVIANIKTVPLIRIALDHPDTDKTSLDHYIFYKPGSPHRYFFYTLHGMPLHLGNCIPMQRLWPQGDWPNNVRHLLQTVEAAENHLAKKTGYEPQLWRWILHHFHDPITDREEALQLVAQ